MSVKKITALIFFAGIAFWFFLAQNLPFTFGDDLNVIHFAIEKSWKDLFLSFLNPLTPGLYIHGMASLESTRAFEPLLFRVLYDVFGFTPNAFWAIKCASAGLVSMMIFLLVWNTTGRTLISILSAVFFFTASPLYRGIIWIADLEIIAQLGTVLASYLFLRIYLGKSKNKIACLLFMILFYWIGMKVKETGRLFPFIALGFIALDQNFKIFGWLKKNFLLTGVLVLLLITVIPIAQVDQTVLDERAQHVTKQFNFSNLATVLWNNPLSGKTPADLAHTFQWPLFITGTLLTLWMLLKRNLMLTYFLVWFGLALAGTSLGFHLEDNERYISVVLVPAVLLFFSAMGLTLNRLGPVTSKLFYLILVVFTVIPIQYNIDHIIWMRNFYDGTNIADWKATKIILKDRYGIEPTWQALDKFYRESSSEFKQIRIKEWDQNKEGGRIAPSDPEAIKQAVKDWKTVYVISYKENLFPTLLTASDTSNGSLYTRLFSKIKKKTIKKFYIYKITA